MMMKAILLICASALPRADCTPESATALVQGPEAGSLATCAMQGQAYVGETALAAYLDDGHYLKVVCTPGGALPPRPKSPLRIQTAVAQDTR